MLGADDEAPTAGVDIEDTTGMGDESGVQQQNMGQDENLKAGISGIHGREPSHPDLPDLQAAEERVDSQLRSPGRPKRTKRPNIKYSQEEYDLSAISVHSKQERISAISVSQYEGQSGVDESRILRLHTSNDFRTERR